MSDISLEERFLYECVLLRERGALVEDVSPSVFPNLRGTHKVQEPQLL
jgi:hypothetical protein